MKKKTFKLKPKKTTQVKAGQKITGKIRKIESNGEYNIKA